MTSGFSAPLFAVGETIAYPAQGIGRVVALEVEEIAGHRLELFVVFFDKGKLTVRVPTSKAVVSGMRKLSASGVVQQALTLLSGRARMNRALWSRRAAEYQAKINSGDLLVVAEVVRDLHRAPNQPEASFSERELYESALELLQHEVSVVNDITRTEALALIHQHLAASIRAAGLSEAQATDAAA